MPAQDVFDHLVMWILALGHVQNLRQSGTGGKGRSEGLAFQAPNKSIFFQDEMVESSLGLDVC
jgi:hypothetical protein